MKSVIDLIIALDKEETKNYITALLKNTKKIKEKLKYKDHYISGVLAYSFTWDDTDQGHYYWSAICIRLNYEEKNEEKTNNKQSVE